jgi:NAD/NADP transhydrogenase beta subunit
VAYQEGYGIGDGAVFSTPTVGVVTRRNCGFAVAGIGNPLFYADPTTCFGDARESVVRSPIELTAI